MHLLGPDNPILHYIDITFFEDEFADRGFSKANVRFRAMNDCFFLLMRSYIRIDLELVRVLDTRMYHEFGSDVILRDFTLKESTYKELKKSGF